MAKLYFTITGTEHYFGQDFFESGMCVKLIKEPDNEVDKEAIRVELDGLGKIGYVANSTRTVLGESVSAGRLYDKLGATATGRVLYVLPEGLLCLLTCDGICAEPEGCPDGCIEASGNCQEPTDGRPPFDCPDGCIEKDRKTRSVPMDCPDGCIEKDDGTPEVFRKCPEGCIKDDGDAQSVPMDCPDGCIESDESNH